MPAMRKRISAARRSTRPIRGAAKGARRPAAPAVGSRPRHLGGAEAWIQLQQTAGNRRTRAVLAGARRLGRLPGPAVPAAGHRPRHPRSADAWIGEEMGTFAVSHTLARAALFRAFYWLDEIAWIQGLPPRLREQIDGVYGVAAEKKAVKALAKKERISDRKARQRIAKRPIALHSNKKEDRKKRQRRVSQFPFPAAGLTPGDGRLIARLDFMASMRSILGSDAAVRKHFRNIKGVKLGKKKVFLAAAAADALKAARDHFKTEYPALTFPQTTEGQKLRGRHQEGHEQGYLGHPLGFSVDFLPFDNPFLSDKDARRLLQIVGGGPPRMVFRDAGGKSYSSYRRKRLIEILGRHARRSRTRRGPQVPAAKLREAQQLLAQVPAAYRAAVRTSSRFQAALTAADQQKLRQLAAHYWDQRARIARLPVEIRRASTKLETARSRAARRLRARRRKSYARRLRAARKAVKRARDRHAKLRGELEQLVGPLRRGLERLLKPWTDKIEARFRPHESWLRSQRYVSKEWLRRLKKAAALSRLDRRLRTDHRFVFGASPLGDLRRTRGRLRRKVRRVRTGKALRRLRRYLSGRRTARFFPGLAAPSSLGPSELRQRMLARLDADLAAGKRHRTLREKLKRKVRAVKVRGRPKLKTARRDLAPLLVEGKKAGVFTKLAASLHPRKLRRRMLKELRQQLRQQRKETGRRAKLRLRVAVATATPGATRKLTRILEREQRRNPVFFEGINRSRIRDPEVLKRRMLEALKRAKKALKQQFRDPALRPLRRRLMAHQRFAAAVVAAPSVLQLLERGFLGGPSARLPVPASPASGAALPAPAAGPPAASPPRPAASPRPGAGAGRPPPAPYGTVGKIVEFELNLDLLLRTPPVKKQVAAVNAAFVHTMMKYGFAPGAAWGATDSMHFDFVEGFQVFGRRRGKFSPLRLLRLPRRKP